MLAGLHVPGRGQLVQSSPPFRKGGADSLSSFNFLRRKWALRRHGQVAWLSAESPGPMALGRLILTEPGRDAVVAQAGGQCGAERRVFPRRVAPSVIPESPRLGLGAVDKAESFWVSGRGRVHLNSPRGEHSAHTGPKKAFRCSAPVRLVG